NVRAGHAPAPELLMDMARLFEQAVARVLQLQAGASGARIEEQESERYLASITGARRGGVFRLRPDLVVRGQTGLLAVGDTKWKRVLSGPRGSLIPATADAYQMHAYAAAYPCEDLCLLYPYHCG